MGKLTMCRRRAGRFALAALTVVVLSWGSRAAAIEGFWKTTVTSGSWGNPDNWVGFVLPNSADATATIATTAPATTIQLFTTIRVGVLNLQASTGTITFNGVGPLTFEATNPAILETLDAGGPRSYVVTSPVRSNTAAGLVIATAGESTLALNGGLTTTAGAVTKRGAGTLRLAGTVTLANPLVIEQGEVRLAGTLTVSDMVLEATGRLTLDGGTLTARGGTFDGVIAGQGQLVLSGGDSQPVRLNGANTFVSPAVVSGRVEANTSAALGDGKYGTLVGGGSPVLDVNAPIRERLVTAGGRINLNAATPHLPQFVGFANVDANANTSIAEHVEGAYGLLNVKADVEVDRLTIRHKGQVRVGATGILRVAEGIDLQEGQLQGPVETPAITKTTSSGAVVSGMPNFDGALTVAGGRLQVFGAAGLGSTLGDTIVTSGRNAQLMLYGPTTVHEEIFLENAAGPDNRGALVANNLSCCGGNQGITLTGLLHLGDQGSVLGGGSAQLVTGAPITGGTLTTVGDTMLLKIQSGVNVYTGATDIRGGRVELTFDGRLSATSKIVVHEVEGEFDSILYVNNLEVVKADRVADTIPIEFRGGELGVAGAATVEKFGEFRFVEGLSRIRTQGATTATSFQRSRGATAYFSDTPLAVEQAPAMVGGVLPWTHVRGGGFTDHEVLGKYAGGKIVALTAADLTTTLAAANAASNVGFVGNQTLTEDKTINSLMMGLGSSLNLNGRQLTVASGGVLGGAISNGTLTAGPESGNELILRYNMQVNASVVDGPGGPLTLTLSDHVTLGGVNFHTGGTVANEGDVRLQTPAALPDGGDFDIMGARVQLAYTATAPKQLGRVRVAGGGSIAPSTGGLGSFSFEELALESGEFRPGRIVGDGEVRKTTIGFAELYGNGAESTFNGDVIVDEGVLDLVGLPQARLTVRGGKLRLLDGANPITLDGGELMISRTASAITVTSRSILSGNSQADARFDGTFHGAGTLVFDGEVGQLDNFSPSAKPIAITGPNPNYSGDVEIQSAHVQVWRSGGLGTGEISIAEGGTLEVFDSDPTAVALANNVTLRGGRLFGGGSNTSPHRVTGQVTVEGRGVLGGVHVLGAVHLTNGSQLTQRDHKTTRLLGDTFVEGAAEIRVGRVESNESTPGFLELGGRIVAGAEESVLHLVHTGIDRYDLTGSLHVPAGRSLEIVEDGVTIPLLLDGVGQNVTGAGELRNAVTVAGGAGLRPGASAGTLTVGPTTILAGGIVHIELGGLAAGEFDVLNIAGDATLGGVLDVDVINGFTPSLGQSWKVIDVAGALAGTFAGKTEGAPVANVGGTLLNVSYVGGDVSLTTSLGVVGDFDFDGVVDGRDFLIWQRGGTARPGSASDLADWRAGYGVGSGVGGAAAGVPEPSAAVLVALAAVGAVRCRRGLWARGGASRRT